MQTRAAAVLAATAFVLLAASAARPARAGMRGQPAPPAPVVTRMRAAVGQFLIRGGDLGQARPDLLTLVEENATTDFTDVVASALGDTAL